MVFIISLYLTFIIAIESTIMKNPNLRTALFCLVIGLSILSYTYIQTLTPAKGLSTDVEVEMGIDADFEETDTKTLPEITLLKKILENGKRVIPASVIKLR